MGMLSDLLASSIILAALAPDCACSRPLPGQLAAESSATISMKASVLPSFRLEQKDAGTLQMMSNAPGLRYHLTLEAPDGSRVPEPDDARLEHLLPPDDLGTRAGSTDERLVLIAPD